MATTQTTTGKAKISLREQAGGCDKGNKMPKIERNHNVGIRLSGAIRPTLGQVYPRGQ